MQKLLFPIIFPLKVKMNISLVQKSKTSFIYFIPLDLLKVYNMNFGKDLLISFNFRKLLLVLRR